MKTRIKLSRETRILGSRYVRAILNNKTRTPEFSETVNLMRGKRFSELYAYEEVLQEVRFYYVGQADYERASKFRDIKERFHEDFLS